jgi:hypothetical protein
VWFRPTPTWEVQVSSGYLREPEELIEGNATRTTTSISWFRTGGDAFKSATVGYGVNAEHGDRRHGAFGEMTIEQGRYALFGRLEFQQVETEVLLTGEVPHDGEHAAPVSTVTAFTVGASRRLLTWKGFEGAIGLAATVYGVPKVLEPSHGSSPVSAQVFFRLRLPTGPMGRMWNMRMSEGHRIADPHAGHR